jgi:hypothetical protein
MIIGHGKAGFRCEFETRAVSDLRLATGMLFQVDLTGFSLSVLNFEIELRSIESEDWGSTSVTEP